MIWEMGNGISQNCKGVEQNDNEALKWYRLAADKGHTHARQNLALMYRIAAVQGDADAQFNLGRIYSYGEGVAQDDAEAMKWHLLSAGQKYDEGCVYKFSVE